jgi:hypothetical protein
LVFAVKELEDGRTFQDYSVRSNSILHLIIRLKGFSGESSKNLSESPGTIGIYLKIVTGRHFTLEIFQTERIEDLKWFIQDKEGIPIEQRKFVFAEIVLKDELAKPP